jgi:hypothetical protein
MLMPFPTLLYTKAQCTHTPVSEEKAEEVPVQSLMRLNRIVLSELKYIWTPPLGVSAPIVNKNSLTSTRLRCTYSTTEKLLSLMLSTSCVTMDLMVLPPSTFPSKVAPPVDSAPQLIEEKEKIGEEGRVRRSRIAS